MSHLLAYLGKSQTLVHYVPLVARTHGQLMSGSIETTHELEGKRTHTVHSSSSVQRHPLHKSFYQSDCFYTINVSKVSGIVFSYFFLKFLS